MLVATDTETFAHPTGSSYHSWTTSKAALVGVLPFSHLFACFDAKRHECRTSRRVERNPTRVVCTTPSMASSTASVPFHVYKRCNAVSATSTGGITHVTPTTVAGPMNAKMQAACKGLSNAVRQALLAASGTQGPSLQSCMADLSLGHNGCHKYRRFLRHMVTQTLLGTSPSKGWTLKTSGSGASKSSISTVDLCTLLNCKALLCIRLDDLCKALATVLSNGSPISMISASSSLDTSVTAALKSSNKSNMASMPV
mmetsp:Transcript_41702/g.93703  ORF Transcript_41702/g.93703 Transcript_41702/m.93703 type:complete len:255 (+) Transcript_41702:199-963(+)